MSQELRDLKEDLKISHKLDEIHKSLDSVAMEIKHLTGTHLKIIYYLLIIVTITLVGVKGLETLKDPEVRTVIEKLR